MGMVMMLKIVMINDKIGVEAYVGKSIDGEDDRNDISQ